jgi:hypothetical protein
MTPEQHMDRVERIAELLARPDPHSRQKRREQTEKIKMIIAAQQRFDSEMLERDKVALLCARKTNDERSYRMPTILRIGPYRFFFYAGDSREPAHVHVVRDDCVAKFWLDPVLLERRGAFRRAELNRVLKLVEEHREELLGGWNDYFNG